MSLAESAASTPELVRLTEHEKPIERGLAAFVEVGNALLAIKADKLYRAAGYTTFEDYCERRWNISRKYGYRLTLGAATVEALANALPEMSPMGDILPTSERQVRPLAAIARDNPTEAAEAWTEAVERSHGGQPTAAEVAEVVTRRRQPKPTPTIPPPGPITPEVARQMAIDDTENRVERRLAYIRRFIDGWHYFRTFRDCPDRDAVLARLIPREIEHITDAEEAMGWTTTPQS